MSLKKLMILKNVGIVLDEIKFVLVFVDNFTSNGMFKNFLSHNGDKNDDKSSYN